MEVSTTYQNPVLTQFTDTRYFGGFKYAYCANNPLRYVDPTGMTWETPEDQKQADKIQKGIGDRVKVLDKQESKINEKIASIQGKTNWSQEKRDRKIAAQQTKLDDISQQRSVLADFDNGITQLGKSDIRYTFNQVDRGTLPTLGSLENGLIIINHSGSIDNKVHEMTHAIQMDNGSLYFDYFGNARAKDIISAEKQAYSTQFSYTGSISLPNFTSERGIPVSLKGVSKFWLEGIKNPATGEYLYRR